MLKNNFVYESPSVHVQHTGRVLLIAIFFLVIGSSGCEKKVTDNSKKDSLKQTVEGADIIQPKLYKGMYYFLAEEGSFTDCDTKKDYILPGNDDEAGLKRVYTLITNNKEPVKKLYIEAEGFVSTQSKKKGNGLDSVLIVTRFVKLDTAVNCIK